MAEDVNKLTDEEVGAIIQARYDSETRQPETEEQRKLAKERRAKVDAMVKENLRKKGIKIN
ncbi:histidine kinase [Lactobacillus iners]|uniref:histidine kinase n=1 Tax=Lactobacillus iners TaxID=147802 RepID=UPI000C9B5A7B|nr:histidine kinase [Lactobacillus iners]PNH16958.1 histidine kinase [Lactobacillus iners]QIH21212.1 histidine kinase [Lactobacillus iners]